MFELLKKYQRYHLTLLLGAMSIICLSMSIFRVLFTKTDMFLFLNWNLFLAFIPWVLSTVFLLKRDLHYRKWYVSLILITWLLFFPNAPYILTDLFHLRDELTMPLWYDLIMILAYAWTGLMFGFVSLFNIEMFLKRYLPRKLVLLTSVFLLFLGAFGIYIGRYLRWNSWDVLQEPFTLLYNVTSDISNPLSHPRAYGMTLLMGVLLNMFYWPIKAIEAGNREDKDIINQ
jgi:uncharacterized membrane protein